MLALLVLYAISSLTLVLSKVLLQEVPVFFLISVRMLSAGIIILGYQYFFARHKLIIHKADWSRLLLAATCSIFLPYGLRYWALRSMPAAKVSLLYNLAPFIAFGLSYFLAQERVTARKILGIAVGVLGTLPVLAAQAPAEELFGLFFISWQELSVLIGLSFMLYGYMQVRVLTKDQHYSVATINGICMLIAGISALIGWILFEPMPHITNIKTFIGILTIIVIGSNLIAHYMYVTLLKKYPLTLMALAKLLAPLYAAFCEWLIFGHIMHWQFFVSLAALTCGVGLFYEDK